MRYIETILTAPGVAVYWCWNPAELALDLSYEPGYIAVIERERFTGTEAAETTYTAYRFSFVVSALAFAIDQSVVWSTWHAGHYWNQPSTLRFDRSTIANLERSREILA